MIRSRRSCSLFGIKAMRAVTAMKTLMDPKIKASITMRRRTTTMKIMALSKLIRMMVRRMLTL